MFVVVITHPDQPETPPRAVGPFETFDLAQAFSQTLVEKWEASGDDAPSAAAVRVEEDMPGVVVGEL
jgi:hypothetical protein